MMPNRDPKMWESQQLFFAGWLGSRIFEEFQHPAIQKKALRSNFAYIKKLRILDVLGFF
jgi:hypothetical protein